MTYARDPKFIKLFDGTWGVKISHRGAVGDVVTVERRDGTQADMQLVEQLSTEENSIWTLWRAKPYVADGARNSARVKPKLRRNGQVTQVPTLSPEPPPLSDADAPPPGEHSPEDDFQ